jgi:hypothetical protein
MTAKTALKHPWLKEVPSMEIQGRSNHRLSRIPFDLPPRKVVSEHPQSRRIKANVSSGEHGAVLSEHWTGSLSRTETVGCMTLLSRLIRTVVLVFFNCTFLMVAREPGCDERMDCTLCCV